MGSANMEAIAFVLGPREAILLMSCGEIIKIVLHQRVVSPPTIPTNIAIQMASVDGGGQGLSVVPIFDPVGQQLTNTAAAASKMHGR